MRGFAGLLCAAVPAFAGGDFVSAGVFSMKGEGAFIVDRSLRG